MYKYIKFCLRIQLFDQRNKHSGMDKISYPFLRYLRVERYFTRPLASLIVKAVFKTTVTPNQLTVVSFLLGLASALCYGGGRPGYFVMGGLFLQLSSIFDCADGMLARSKNMCSKFGALLDLFCDRVADFCVLLGIAFGQYRYSGDQLFLRLALVGTGLYFLQVTLYYLMRHHEGRKSIGQAAESRGLAIFAVLLLSLLNRLDIVILILVFEPLINLLFKTIRIIRWRYRADPDP